MYRYEIKQVPGSQRKGIFVDGMLLAKIVDPRMEREADMLVKLGQMALTGEYLRPPPPVVIQCGAAGCKGPHRPYGHNTVTEAEIREDLDRRSL